MSTKTNVTKNSSGSLIEGEGIFRDYNGSIDGTPVYETKDPDEWLEYCKEKKLTRSGSSACVVCNTVFEFQNLQVGKNPICEKCKGELI